MTSKPVSCNRHIFRTLLLVAFGSLAAVGANAQTTNQPITNHQQTTNKIGLVLDADTREPLIGAAVLISGTTTGTTTDFDGLFSLPVQSSDTLVISYMGYQTARLTPKTQQDTLKVLLTTNSEVLQEVAVVSKRRQNSEMSVLRSTKTALSVQTGISSEQIQRTQDRDASEVIRRVPGISLIDDKFVMVRGLSQRYNQVWINGAAVPGSEADSRAFSFDLLPSSQLDNLVIIKSPAPEYPADYSGGMVLVQTRDVPEYRAWQINLGGAMNDQTTADLSYAPSPRPPTGSASIAGCAASAKVSTPRSKALPTTRHRHPLRWHHAANQANHPFLPPGPLFLLQHHIQTIAN